MRRCPSGCDKVSPAPQKHPVLGTGRSVLDGAVPVAGKHGCVWLYQLSCWLDAEPGRGLGLQPEPSSKLGSIRKGTAPHSGLGAGWGGLGSSSPGQHSNLQQVGHVPGLGAGAGPSWGPCRLEKTSRVKPCSGEGHSGEQQSGPRDLQKPRGAAGGWKPRVKSSHTSRMGQCHRPQWP